MHLLAIFIGGGLGSLFRYGVGVFVKQNVQMSLPLGTLLANILACLVMGVTLLFFKDKLTQYTWLKPMILVGFCGGFSTFSTFSLETFQLIKGGDLLWAVLNILISVILCVGLLALLLKNTSF